jgi:Carboxypeptidase regulatory-like domain
LRLVGPVGEPVFSNQFGLGIRHLLLVQVPEVNEGGVSCALVFLSGFSILFSISLLLAISGAWAQTGTTSLRGTILDKSGASVVGATIKLTSPELGVQRSTVSNDTGAYEFLSLKLAFARDPPPVV